MLWNKIKHRIKIYLFKQRTCCSTVLLDSVRLTWIWVEATYIFQSCGFHNSYLETKIIHSWNKSFKLMGLLDSLSFCLCNWQLMTSRRPKAVSAIVSKTARSTWLLNLWTKIWGVKALCPPTSLLSIAHQGMVTCSGRMHSELTAGLFEASREDELLQAP